MATLQQQHNIETMPPRRGRAPVTGKPAFFDIQRLERFAVKRGFDAVVAQRLWRVVIRALRDGGGESDDEVWERASKYCIDGRQKLPKVAVELASQNFRLFSSKLAHVAESKDTQTTKLVIELRDGHRVESVAMRHKSRTTVCVSSQIGCAMGCQFCATGTMNLIGDLDTCEILEQVALITRHECARSRPAPRNVVFMGMGEPLANYQSVSAAVTHLCDPFHFALRKKGVTVSTVGVAPALKKLTREHPEVRVALSLHAPSQELRARIVPAAKQWPLHELIEALDDHLNSVSRHSGSHDGLMIEYVLLKGVNDRREDADQLIALLRGKPVMLNLIPYNPNVTATLHGFEAPSIESCRAFGKVIIEGGLRVRLREEFGQDINAACGQLALATKDIEDLAPAPPAPEPAVASTSVVTDATAPPPPPRKPRAPPPKPPPPQWTALATASLAAAALAASLAAAAAVLR